MAASKFANEIAAEKPAPVAEAKPASEEDAPKVGYPEWLDKGKPVSSQLKAGDIAHGFFYNGSSNEQVIGRVLRASKDSVMVELPDGKRVKLSSNLGVFRGDVLTVDVGTALHGGSNSCRTGAQAGPAGEVMRVICARQARQPGKIVVHRGDSSAAAGRHLGGCEFVQLNR